MFVLCISITQAWHKECFKCGNCSKGLDSILCCEGPDKNIYCKGKSILKIQIYIYIYIHTI